MTQQIESIILYLKTEEPNVAVSIARVCREAKISRSNFYETYPELVQKIREGGVSGNAGEKSRKKTSADYLAEIAELKKRLDATTLVCIELQIERKILQDKINRLSKDKRRR